MSAGVIGLGPESPVWTIQGTEAYYGEALFDVFISNYNDWTFADSEWVATTTDSYIGLGYDSDTNYDKYDWENYQYQELTE